MPPEALWSGESRYDKSLDVFSLGVLMLEISTQQEPANKYQGIATIPEVERRAEDLAKMKDWFPLILICFKMISRRGPRPLT